MNEIKNLEPQIVWKNSCVDPCSASVWTFGEVQQFLLDWAAAHGIEAFKDKGENIVMRKPATPGWRTAKSRHASPHGHGAAEDGGEPA